ncbi:MAG: hypothetical protein WAO08_01715, partial [Hyphomicrobiaceae bacterium]
LFSSTEWFSVRETRKKATFDEISALDANRILNTSVETLCKYYEDKNAIEVPVLDRLQVVIDPREVTRRVNDYGRHITVTATEIDVSVPFVGASDAFHIQPSMYTSSPPYGQIAGGLLTFVVDAYSRNKQQVKQEIGSRPKRWCKSAGHGLSSPAGSGHTFRPPRCAAAWPVDHR